MNFVKMITILSIGVYFFSSCEDSEEVKHRIVGKWNWIQSFGGYAGHYITPQSAGYSKTIIFDVNKYYSVFRDDSLTEKTTYQITYEDIWGDQELEEILTIEGDPIKQVIEFEGIDTLKLLENCFDCYNHTFIRIQ
jgi:hypothetical protein